MERLIIDTSVLIDLERAGHTIVDLGRAYPDAGFALAAITLSELLVGAFRANSLERRRKREAFAGHVIQAANLIPFDRAIARRYALTWAELGREGQLINPHDLMIAATALTEGATILTRDLRDFPKVPDLEIQVFDLAILGDG